MATPNTYVSLAILILYKGTQINQVVDVADSADLTDGAYSDEQAQIQKALDAANSMIDAYLRTRYSLPLNDSDPHLESIAVDLAWYNLLRYRQSVINEDDENRNRASLRFLQDVSNGKARLDIAPDTDVKDDLEPGRIQVGSNPTNTNRDEPVWVDNF